MPHRDGGAGTRRRGTLLHLPLVLAAICCACSTPDSSPPLQIALHPAVSPARPAYVAVGGLSSSDRSSLRDRLPTDPAWPSLLTIVVGDAAPPDSLPAVQGRYAVTDSAITFTPLFPFDPGRSYRVAFDPAQLPRPRPDAKVSAVVRLPPAATEPATAVTAVHPSAEIVPENLLRVYIEFSAPMGSGSGLDFVRLVELSGPDGRTERVEPGAFLPVEANFWSPDHTRYTLFFDPGRVKAGILPNRQSGRPLRAGRQYVLDISPTWTDANGLPLKTGYRHAFRAGPAVDEAIGLADWKLAPPASGTRDPLTVRFPRPLDHGILVRALGVETGRGRSVDGEISLEAHDAGWAFTPVASWQSGEYNLVARAFLEDPQGNQIGRAFEVFADELKSEQVPEAFRVAFTIAGPR